MTSLDVDFARRQFPAFSAPSLDEWRFFENAGGSYACGPVVDRLTRFYIETKLQPYGPSAPSRRGGEQMDEARSRWAAYLGVDTDEVSFGPSTTQNAYVLAHAFRAGWAAGDEIVVTNQDHEANIGAWRRLEDTGITVREWSANPETGELALADLEALVNDKTRLVACTHCSNIVASPNPIRDIRQRLPSAVRLVVDGVAYAPHALPDLSTLGADVYLFSLYKVYGPHLGLMYIRRDVMPELANQAHWFNGSDPNKRLVPAGPDHAQVAAAAGVIDYFDALDRHHFPEAAEAHTRGARIGALMRRAEQDRLTPLLDFLRARGARVLGPSDPAHRMPTVAVATDAEPTTLAQALADRSIVAGASHFYAPRLLERMGVPSERGVLRLSFVHYTSEADIEALIEALDAVLSG